MVWKVTRRMDGSRMNRATLLASLREKYGKESAVFGGSQGQARDDREISRMVWVTDEQGRRPPMPPADDYSCDNVGETPNLFLLEIRGNHFPAGPCTSLIRTTAGLTGDTDIVTTLDMEMTDMPLGLRTARAMTHMVASRPPKLRQQDIEQTKQARPKL